MEGQGARILYALGWGLSRGVPAPAHLALLAVGRVGPSVQSKPFREMKCWQLGVQLLALTQQSLREHGGTCFLLPGRLFSTQPQHNHRASCPQRVPDAALTSCVRCKFMPPF